MNSMKQKQRAGSGKHAKRGLKLEAVDADGRAWIARIGVRVRCCFVCAKLVHNPYLLTWLGAGYNDLLRALA